MLITANISWITNKLLEALLPFSRYIPTKLPIRNDIKPYNWSPVFRAIRLAPIAFDATKIISAIFFFILQL